MLIGSQLWELTRRATNVMIYGEAAGCHPTLHCRRSGESLTRWAHSTVTIGGNSPQCRKSPVGREALLGLSARKEAIRFRLAGSPDSRVQSCLGSPSLISRGYAPSRRCVGYPKYRGWNRVLLFSPMVNCNWVCQCHFCTASELLLLLSIGMTPVDSRLNHEEPVRCEPDRDESEHPFSVR